MPRLEFKASSNLVSAELRADGITVVEFKRGKFAYANMTADMFTEWAAAASAGSWFHNNVRQKPDAYPVVTMPEDAAPAAAAAAAAEASTPVEPEPAPVAEPAVKTPQPGRGRHTPAPKIDIDDCTPEIREHARELYEGYIENSDGKNYEGKVCPPWDDLTAAIRSNWCATELIAARRRSAAVSERDATIDRLRIELELARAASIRAEQASRRPPATPMPPADDEPADESAPAAPSPVGPSARNVRRPWRKP